MLCIWGGLAYIPIYILYNLYTTDKPLVDVVPKSTQQITVQGRVHIYKLDAESKKLRALESCGGPEL